MQEQCPNQPQLETLLDTDGQPDPKDQTIAALERENSILSDKLYEERFVWIVVAVILFDAYVFSSMENWTGPIVIGVLELVAIVIMADRCKVNTVAPLIDKLTGFIRPYTRHGEPPSR